MERRKIVMNAEPLGYSEVAIQKWEALGYTYSASSWEEIHSRTWEEIEILIVRLARRVTAEDLKLFPNLKYLVSATTGLDHINLSSLDKRNIKLLSLRGKDEFLASIPSTAEHTWALLMTLIRNVPKANDSVLQGNWNRDLFRGYQLKNKQIGIIGLGRTGRKVAKYAAVFDMRVGYYDPYVTDNAYTKYDSLEELLQTSDIITLHVHLTGETENMLNAQNMSNIKDEAYLINTSRGKLIDEKAIVALLQQKKIRGIATDVLATELNDITKSTLWQAQQRGENVLITPHIGGASWDAMWACEEFVVKSFV